MPGNHKRNTGPMHESLRCGAKTRRGTPCQSPAVRGKKRCRMHGGAKGSGAPLGNKNALKHGFYTKEAIAERKKMTDRDHELSLSRQAELPAISGNGPDRVPWEIWIGHDCWRVSFDPLERYRSHHSFHY